MNRNTCWFRTWFLFFIHRRCQHSYILPMCVIRCLNSEVSMVPLPSLSRVRNARRTYNTIIMIIIIIIITPHPHHRCHTAFQLVPGLEKSPPPTQCFLSQFWCPNSKKCDFEIIWKHWVAGGPIFKPGPGERQCEIELSHASNQEYTNVQVRLGFILLHLIYASGKIKFCQGLPKEWGLFQVLRSNAWFEYLWNISKQIDPGGFD